MTGSHGAGRPQGGPATDTWPSIQEALRLDPASASLQLRMAYVLKNRSMEQDALRHCEEAIRLDPVLSSAHFLRARLVLDMGLWDRALEAIMETVRLEPGSQSLVRAAELLEEMGEYGAAARYLSQAVSMAPARSRRP